MTAASAREYAERIYEEMIKPIAIISEQSAGLIKERLAHAYMDGGLALAASLNFSRGAETTEQRIEQA